jgi:chromosome segregation ATPase
LIQSILFFSLGFLTAGLLALMVAPAIWRRAVSLTRRRLEASLPLSANEIQADKDRMRAEFAMSTRRLEMRIKSLSDKVSTQIIEINRNGEELRRLAEERAARDRTVAELETRVVEMRADISSREEQLQRLMARLGEAEDLLEDRAREIERLGQMYDEATLSASNRQIELVARESEFDRMAGNFGALQNERKAAEKRLREMAAESRAAQQALKDERKRAADLDRKLERMMATVSDREDKLARREKELARIRDEMRTASVGSNDLDSKLTQAQADRLKLEAEVAELQLRLSARRSGGDVEATMDSLQKERDRQADRLATLVRENKKLRSELEAIKRSKAEDGNAERRDSALLREQINDLAAEMVHLTAMIDGSNSPIAQILAAAPEGAGTEGGERIVSLADRVKALQKAASATSAAPEPVQGNR